MKKILLSVTLLIFCLPFFSSCQGTIIPDDKTVDLVATSQNVLRSVVALSFTDVGGEQESTVCGSGIIVFKDDGGGAYIATNLHVVYQCDADDDIRLSLYGSDEDSYAIGKIICSFTEYDIAILYSEDLCRKFDTVCSADFRIEMPHIPGEYVLAVGNAMGNGLSVTGGLISMDSEYVAMSVPYQSSHISLEQIRIDAPLNQGCSGGGLFDTNGRLVGMLNARNSKEGVSSIGYAIPADTLKLLIAKAVSAHSNQRSVVLFDLGAGLQEKNVSYFWSSEKNAWIREYDVTLADINVGSAASLFLENGDVIESIQCNDADEIRVTCRHDIENVLLLLEINDTVIISYRRNGEKMRYSLHINEGYLKTIEMK